MCADIELYSVYEFMINTKVHHSSVVGEVSPQFIETHMHGKDRIYLFIYTRSTNKTRMWVNAQRDGRPAKYGGALCSTPQFG